jgi:hypothetical protein
MNVPGIPTDPETLAAWALYELRNAAANAEYRHRHGAVKEADKKAQARRLHLISEDAA